MSLTPKDAILSVAITLVGATAAAFIGGDGVFNKTAEPVAVQSTPQAQTPAPAVFQPLIPATQPTPEPVATTAAIEQAIDTAAGDTTATSPIDQPATTLPSDPTPDPLTTLHMQVEQANQKLNLVWNATSAAVRQKLLTEQRAWLKKRDLDCQLQSLDVAPDAQDQRRLICERDVTTQRVQPLRQAIERQETLLAQQPLPSAPVTAANTEDEITQRVAAQNAAQMQQNLRQLERQLDHF